MENYYIFGHKDRSVWAKTDPHYQQDFQSDREQELSPHFSVELEQFLFAKDNREQWGRSREEPFPFTSLQNQCFIHWFTPEDSDTNLVLGPFKFFNRLTWKTHVPNSYPFIDQIGQCSLIWIHRVVFCFTQKLINLGGQLMVVIYNYFWCNIIIISIEITRRFS